jgi:hypothetical protein
MLAAGGTEIVLLLSRNNGIEWLDVCANPASAVRLYCLASELVREC